MWKQVPSAVGKCCMISRHGLLCTDSVLPELKWAHLRQARDQSESNKINPVLMNLLVVALVVLNVIDGHLWKPNGYWEQVLYSAWVELCEGMSSARSLDEVKSCHDSYLVSIQRQCLVAPDKLVCSIIQIQLPANVRLLKIRMLTSSGFSWSISRFIQFHYGLFSYIHWRSVLFCSYSGCLSFCVVL